MECIYSACLVYEECFVCLYIGFGMYKKLGVNLFYMIVIIHLKRITCKLNTKLQNIFKKVLLQV